MFLIDGKDLKELRYELGFLKSDMKQELEVSMTTITNWETGTKPRNETLKQVIRYLQYKGYTGPCKIN